MKLTRTRSCALAAALTCTITSADAADQAALQQQLEALRAEQRQLSDMQARIDAKLRALEAEVAPAPASTAQPTPTAAAEPPKLVVTGDMRVRSQGDYADGARDRTSGQVRGRLGATYAASDRVIIGARLATGDPDDPNSSDVQLSNFNDDLQVSLDQAYLQLNLDTLKLYAGKIPQPFVRTELVWDGDVNPQGASAVYKHAFANGTALRANGLYFIVDDVVAGGDSTMLGAQIGFDSPNVSGWKFDVSAAYFDYSLGSASGGDAGDFRSNRMQPDGRYASDFDLADLIVGATWGGLGDRWPLRIATDYVRNLDAATDDDTGYGAEVTLGRLRQLHDWRLSYGYWLAETDAVLAAFSHDNIALGTNYRLHALTFDFMPFRQTQLSAIWYHYQPLEVAPSATREWIERVRLALTVSF